MACVTENVAIGTARNSARTASSPSTFESTSANRFNSQQVDHLLSYHGTSDSPHKPQHHAVVTIVSVGGLRDPVLHPAGHGDLVREGLLGLHDGILDLVRRPSLRRSRISGYHPAPRAGR